MIPEHLLEYYLEPAPVEFTPAGETDEERDAVLEQLADSQGFPAATTIVAEAIHKDADVTVLDFTQQQVTVRFRVDGMWHPGVPMDRETGDYMLAVLKKLAGANYQERRKKQKGMFATAFLKGKQKFKLISQGTQTGERVALYLDYKRPSFDRLEDCGMRQSMISQVVDLMNMSTGGWFLVSAVPGEGYTTSWRAALDSCDRLTRDFFVIEDCNKVEPEVINIGSITFDPAKGETHMTPLPQLLLREPDVLSVSEIPDGKMLDKLCNQSTINEIPIYLRHPGKNAVDALLRVLALKPDANKFLASLSGVLCMRLVRKLCENCRQAYVPHPQLLQKLGLPAGRIEKLYRPFIYKPGMVDEDENEIPPCRECSGIGYRGRTGIFELLKVTPAFRNAAAKTLSLSALTAAAKQEGHITQTQEAAVLIARGVTSVEELQRMLQS